MREKNYNNNNVPIIPEAIADRVETDVKEDTIYIDHTILKAR